MLRRKLARILCPLTIFAWLLIVAGQPVIAEDSNRTPAYGNRVPKLPDEGEILPGKIRPGAFHGPLMPSYIGPQHASGILRLGLGAPRFVTTVTAIHSDALTVQTPEGPETFTLPPGRLAASAIRVGTMLTITRNLNDATLQLHISGQPRTGYTALYVGTVENAGLNFVSLRLPGGAVRTFRSDRHVSQIASALSGKIIALQSNDGRSVGSLLTSEQLKSIVDSIANSRRASAQRPSVPTTPPNNSARPVVPSSQSRCRLPAIPSKLRAKLKPSDEAACPDVAFERRPAQRTPPRVPSHAALTPMIGCSNSDSAAIFIALRHWRSQTPVRGASVDLSGPANVTLNSPPSGYIELLNVPSGTYHLSVRKNGFRRLQTSKFRVDCNEGIRVQANLQTAPPSFRLVRIPKRAFVFRVVSKQKSPLQCFYGSGAMPEASRTLESPFVLRTVTGLYVCGVKKLPVKATVPRVRRR